MFRRQKPPSMPVKPEPPPPAPEPAPASGGGPGFVAAVEPPAPQQAPATPAAGERGAYSSFVSPTPPSTGSETSTRPSMNTPFSTSPAPGTAPGAALKSDIPRRVVDIPGTPPKRTTPSTDSATPATEMRKLIVGRDISLSGEIAACDVLVVEGTVEAKLRDGRIVEIADTGLFKGSVEIDDADIGGRFEGDITVRGTLRVRATGKIQGNIRYGTLEVENGGQLSGTVEVLTGTAAKAPAPAPVYNPAPILADGGLVD
ncbi:protein CcmA, bactofilin family [Azospirillum sp. RU38E]|nr:protein CcmA, bactofilin family [Azospirillum sp. RU38E]SNT28061.1 protein CcmA, bactofilin family [Azospirillum sp. RU37A]